MSTSSAKKSKRSQIRKVEKQIINAAIDWHLEMEKEGASMLGGKIERAVARYLKLKGKS